MNDVIGIIGAMEGEVKSICSSLENHEEIQYANLCFHKGLLNNKTVIVVKSGIGKVNAALCAQALILKFGVTKLINTGIAGATGSGLKIFDFVVSSHAVYHDFDTTFFGYKIGQVPGMEEVFTADATMANLAVKIFQDTPSLNEHKIQKGLIASGDQFISSGEKKDFIKNTFKPLCVEMEGAAIAHACSLYKIPFVILRCMSDMADDSDTGNNVYTFNEDTASEESAKFLIEFINKL